LEHMLRPGELGKAGSDGLRGVFFGSGDPRSDIETLRDDPRSTRKQLRTLAGDISLVAREDKKGAQPDGRIALVWWDTKGKRARRSTAAKGNVFDPATDRLLAALAVLDNKSIRRGKWVSWDDARPTLSGPVGWPKVEGSSYVRGQAIGFALSSARPLSAGDFTLEPGAGNAARSVTEDRIARWMSSKKGDAKSEYANERDRAVVLIVYEYEKPSDFMPVSYRYYAVSASGKLKMQCRVWGQNRKNTSHGFASERNRSDDN
jgi:hypothetical protein